jgi:hypothetical protein
MNRDDIIKWAREAGFMFCEESYKHRSNCLFYGGYAVDEQLERFEALVRADERKKLSQHFQQSNEAGIHSSWVAAAIKEASGQA